MNNRIFLGALIGIGITTAILSYAPAPLLHDPFYQLALAALLESTCACLGLVVFGKKLLKKSWGQTVFRSIFISHCMSYSFWLGMMIRQLLIAFPGSIFAISSSTIVLLGCSIAVSTFSFDIFAMVLFLLSGIAPVVYCTVFEIDGAIGISAVYSGGFFFYCYLGWSIHLAEIGVLGSQELIKKQSADLTKANANLIASNKLHEETLNSIDEFILNIGLDGVCFGNTVARCAAVLGIEPNGRHFTELLALEGEAKDAAVDWFNMIATDQVDFELLADNGPRQFRLQLKEEKVFHVKYFPKRNNETLVAVVMTISDVTTEKRNKDAADEAISRANFVLAAQENPAGLKRFLHESTLFFADLTNLETAPADAIRLRLHTYKGTAAMYYLTAMADAINALEMQLKDIGSESSAVKSAVVREGSARILDTAEKWKATEEKTLSRLGIFDDDRLTILRSQAELLQAAFAGDEDMSLTTALTYLTAPSLERLLTNFETVAVRVAKRTGKQVEFKVEKPKDSVLVLSPEYLAAFESLIHLFTNAVDHGLEIPSIRIAARKPAIGSVQVRYYREDSQIVITIEDDGLGINANQIRESLKRKGIKTEGLTEREILRSILDAGVTTVDVATDLSGQGVGLSALDDKIKSLGGTIEIYTEVGQWTRFEIRLPIREGLLVFKTLKQKTQVA